MDRGTYSVTSLGLAKIQQLEITNNNLANVNTPGFKRQVLVGESQSFDQTLARLVANQDPYAEGDHQRTPGVVSLESRVDFSAGPVRQTGNPFDVALTQPNEFFVVATPQGERYTRAGNFTLNVDGSIVTQDGSIVQGDGGAITIQEPNGRISEDGSVVVNNLPVGRIRVVRFDSFTGLKPEGGTRFKLEPGVAQPTPVETRMVVGSLEMSNVSAISSMIDLVTTNRGFEAYTRTAQTIDQMNQTAITQVGRPR
jgi:flagellar basal-body rod protein FlgF